MAHEALLQVLKED